MRLKKFLINKRKILTRYIICLILLLILAAGIAGFIYFVFSQSKKISNTPAEYTNYRKLVKAASNHLSILPPPSYVLTSVSSKPRMFFVPPDAVIYLVSDIKYVEQIPSDGFIVYQSTDKNYSFMNFQEEEIINGDRIYYYSQTAYDVGEFNPGKLAGVLNWSIGNTYYSIISGVNLTKDELVKIAESMR